VFKSTGASLEESATDEPSSKQILNMDSDSDDIYGAEETDGRKEVNMDDIEDGEEEGEEVEDDSDVRLSIHRT
jgi:hypothetical protein